MRDYGKMDKLGRGKWYSPDHRHFPMTKTDYEKVGSRWKEVGKENSLISRNQVNLTLADEGLPFERSHRHSNANRYQHSNKWDTFESISPDGKQKSRWFVDFPAAYKKERKLSDKAYYDKMRYLKKKAEKDTRK